MYKILKADSLINEQQLEELAKEGWDLIAIASQNEEFYFYFRQMVIVH